MDRFQELEVVAGVILGIVGAVVYLFVKEPPARRYRYRQFANRLMAVVCLASSALLVLWALGQGKPQDTLYGFAALMYWFFIAVFTLGCMGVLYLMGRARAEERAERGPGPRS